MENQQHQHLVRRDGLFGGTPGPGRPKGSKNAVSARQREFAEMVLGKRGTREFKEFILVLRGQVMRGTCPPPILTLLIHYLEGKPADRIEVAEVQKDVGELSRDALRIRAMRLVERELALREQQMQDNTFDSVAVTVTPVEVKDEPQEPDKTPSE